MNADDVRLSVLHKALWCFALRAVLASFVTGSVSSQIELERNLR